MRIGVLGGTFNPIHMGHLTMAEQVRNRYNLNKVIFVPSARPPHKPDLDLIDADNRLRMTELAVSSNLHFEVSRIELDRSGKSYTGDTLAEMARLYPGAELYYIVGSDSILEIDTWRDPIAVLQQAKFLVVNRPGHDLDKADEKYLKHVERVPIGGIDISSTMIRQKLRNGESIRHLVPEEVERFILENHLYGS